MPSHTSKINLATAIAFIALFLTAPTYGQSNYVAFELERDNNWDNLITEDVNGDGAKDIIFAHFDPAIGRELHIHHQQSDGNFASNPQRVEIKTEIIAVGFAELRPDPGKELVLFANNGVFSLSTAKQGYADNIKLLFQWNLVAAIPDLETVQFLQNIEDINGDGEIDFLLPGENDFGFFVGQGEEQFELVSSVRTINENLTAAQRNNQEADLSGNIGINETDGVIVNIRAELPSPFANFIEQWEPKATDSRALLRTENWMPTAMLEELNGDGLKDLIYLNVADDGLGQINIHFQAANKGFSNRPDWQSSLETRGDIQIVDMNNDGLQDLLRLSGDGNEWDARFYINAGGSFDFQQASQVMRFSGYDVRLDFVELAADSKPVLNVSYYTIPVVDAIRNASINRTQLLYSADEAEAGQLFARRPSSRLEESFSASNVRGLSEQMSLRYDVDGDGSNDALYVTDNGTLAAKKISSDLQIADAPFWEYVSPRTVFEFQVLTLNNDSNPDLVLRHGTTTSLLVATP
jgi:hypothetical protein